jgi:hypothetical protein
MQHFNSIKLRGEERNKKKTIRGASTSHFMR